MIDAPEQRTRMMMNAIKQPNQGLLRLGWTATGP